MLAAFWSGLGGEFAKQWVARVLTPAFVFWAAGLALLWWHAHAAGVRAYGWAAELTATAKPLQALPVLGQGVLLFGALLLLAASGLVAERLTLPLLRILEGYWSRPVWLWRLLVRWSGRRRDRWSRRVAPLRTRQRRGSLTVGEYVELLRLEGSPSALPERLADLRRRRAEGFTAHDAAVLARGLQVLRRVPESPPLRMPSRLGNLLRAAERRPIDKYGIDPAVCWTALWLLLPAEAKTELTQSRAALDSATRIWLWGALFLVWTPWSWWALPIGILVPVLAYYGGMLNAASLFGDLMVAAFDLHRLRLYDDLRLPRPQSPVQERRQAGPRVTNMLWGGLDEPGLSYTADATPPAAKP